MAGDIHISRPFIDEAGAGYLVSLSKTVYSISNDLSHFIRSSLYRLNRPAGSR